MAYFIDGRGILLFDVSIEIFQNGKSLQIIEEKQGNSIKETLIKLKGLHSLYGDGVKYSLTWNWKAENQDYKSLVEFLRGPIDTVTS